MSAADVKKTRAKRPSPRPGLRSLSQASVESRQRGAAVLEVLAGVRTPAEAAAVLGVSAARYYLLEQRAIAALVRACEPSGRKRQSSAERQLARLERELARCQRECGRHQALARATQRSLGLNPPASPHAKGQAPTAGRRRRARRPVVRALRMAKSLQRADSSGTAVANGVEPSVQT